MKRGLWALAVGTALAAFGSGAMADNVSYDQSLTGPGWYNGTSPNPNGGFTVDTESNGIEVGLRAKLRQNPNVINSSTNVYQVPAGSEPGVPARCLELRIFNQSWVEWVYVSGNPGFDADDSGHHHQRYTGNRQSSQLLER